jgi:type II secretory pathway component PulF
MSSSAASSSAAAQAASRNRVTGGKPKAADESRSLFGKKRIKPFPRKELIKFCRGMASMLKAQINTSDALKYYGQDHPNAEVKSTLKAIGLQIDAGAPAYAAFAKTRRFDDKLIGLIRAGCDSGQLHKAFAAISDRLKKEAVFKAKVRKAILLPILVILALVGIFITAQLKVVPQIESILSDFNAEADQFTKIVFKVSHVTQKIWPLIIISIVSFGLALAKIPKFRNGLVYLMMSKWRLLRNLIMGLRQMLFLGTMHMLHANGITLAKAVAVAAESVKGTPLFEELVQAGKKYQHSGLPFSESIRKFTSCDPQVSHMIAIGERSSSLEMQLQLLTDMYEEDVEQMVSDFTNVVTLLALMAASLLISFVFIGAFLPIFLMGPKMMNSQGM